MFMILTRGDTPHGNADMAKLADAHDSGSCGKPCRFKSCYPHQQKESSTNSTAFFLPFYAMQNGFALLFNRLGRLAPLSVTCVESLPQTGEFTCYPHQTNTRPKV